jgi:mRNA interferase HicA
MNRRELEERLKEAGWYLARHGSRHDVWTDGEQQEPVPRHREINERLARAILRRVERRK